MYYLDPETTAGQLESRASDGLCLQTVGAADDKLANVGVTFLPSSHTEVADFVYTYLLSCEELIDTYSRAGGKIGTLNPANPDDLHHARRAIFQYLPPASMHVWYASPDGHPDMTFIVGEPDCPLRESVNLDLAKRCYGIFGRPPDLCLITEDLGDLNHKLTLRDGAVHLLWLREFMHCVPTPFQARCLV